MNKSRIGQIHKTHMTWTWKKPPQLFFIVLLITSGEATSNWQKVI